ncbi:hydroxyacylglutathione hydrolase [Cyanobium sp. CH-040]|uniref:hydroxyacylglutathione hydrolase n=1 Tax=Cyanobium sp. CH-040 TaxID=2823708 RepID=UPI0020CF0868|nr:hydroxyacylglutathione hydrolase [Cyanobium sp. CH-040]MCP9928195.1 hydroxyacylglutathione hydrolase [Cyanobium sp. CH-040]
MRPLTFDATAAAASAGTPLQVWLIPVLHDNYVVVLQRGRRAAVVDPAVAGPVQQALEERGLELEAILHTHHHSDHIGGAPGLLRRWPGAAVIAAAADRERIPLQTRGVAGGDRLELLGEPVEVIEVPGHTRAHIAYWLPASGHLFCGDTLFAGGCGRLFEGTPEQMHASLQRLAALPETTRVWCAHEYTEANLRWAAAERPGDREIRDRLAAVVERRRRGLPTIPSTIASERATNLFLRTQNGAELARLRRSKDDWRSPAT